MNYNGLLASKFAGCPLIGTLHDQNRDRTIKAFKIPDENPDLVGVYDGVDTWIANKKYSLFGLQPAGTSSARVRVQLTTRRKVLL